MKYRKKPVVIDAFKWTGDICQEDDPIWICDAIRKHIVYFSHEASPKCIMKINTQEGIMTANRGDYIIQGINGEIYPCKPDIFEKTYERVEE